MVEVSTPRPTPSMVLSAALIARLHTRLAFTAFVSALLLGCALHYKKIVKNGVAGYPEEWYEIRKTALAWAHAHVDIGSHL
jgi:hypothetical protein